MRNLTNTLRNVLALVGVLSILSLALQNIFSHHECRSATEVKALADLRALERQITLFHQDNGYFPRHIGDLVGSYLAKEPLDPWGNKYQMIQESDGVYLFTYNLDKALEKYRYRIEYGI